MVVSRERQRERGRVGDCLHQTILKQSPFPAVASGTWDELPEALREWQRSEQAEWLKEHQHVQAEQPDGETEEEEDAILKRGATKRHGEVGEQPPVDNGKLGEEEGATDCRPEQVAGLRE